MKNGRAFLAILFACVLGVSAITTVSAQDSGLFDLAITQIETVPFSAAVGEDVTVYVTYENLLPTPVPSSLLLDLVLTVTDAQTRQVIEQCRQPLDLAGLSSIHEPKGCHFQTAR